ncbi:hypothetical protein CUR178_00846 [Leishmania enriettii]|uniref:F-box domain-containing protein n=1 Tax=Leishmania enriettii TaxID=5663 RepID=A0A836GKI7_LEIEN|nr:hypothetical protein CUR178_00846 [Leishmania enriettii]
MKKVRSCVCPQNKAAPRAQRRCSRSPSLTSKTAAPTFSQEKPCRGRSAPRQPSSPHPTPSSSSTPVAASYPSQETQTSATASTGSSAGTSSSRSTSRTRSTNTRSCSSASHGDARWGRFSRQRHGYRNSRLLSQQQWKKHRIALREAYSHIECSSSSSATSRGCTSTKSAETSTDSWPSRRRSPSRMNEDDAFLSSPSFTSVDPHCVFTNVLPHDVYLHICSFLNEMDCCTLLEVSLCMHAAITSADSIVWRHLCMSTWMYKQGFQMFIQRARALGVLARQEELEVQALQQHMLLLREQGTIFGESDVSATCDCATVLMRRRQHERAQWMAAATATATNAATPTLYRTRSTNKVSNATTSVSSPMRTGSGSETTSGRRLCHQSRRSRHRHRSTQCSTTATTSTSRRSGKISAQAGKWPTHAARQAEPPEQRRGSRSAATTVTSRASRSRRNPVDRFRDDDGASESLSHSCSSRTWSSSGSSAREAARNRKQAYLPDHHRSDDAESRPHSHGAGASEKGCSAACPSPLSSSPSSHTRALAEPRERGGGSSSSVLRSTNASDGEGKETDEHLRTNGKQKVDRGERRVYICLPGAEAKADVNGHDGNANLTDTSVLAVRSESGSRHRRRSRRSLSGNQLSPTHYHCHHHWHDGSSREQQQQQQRCLQPPVSGHRRSRRERRRKPARQRRRKHSRSRGPRSTGGGGGRHRSQRHRSQSRHRPSHQHHHNPKATKSSRRRRRRQRNAAAANAATCAGSNAYFYQTATYAAIKSTTPVLSAQHVAPSVAPFKLGGGPVPSASGAESFVPRSLSKTQQLSHKPCGSEMHTREASAGGAVAQTAAPLNIGGNRVQMAVPSPTLMGSTSYLVMSPQAAVTASSAATASGAGPNEEGLYWWQLTPEVRQRQLRRMQQRELQQQQQQLAASSGGFTTRGVSSLQDEDELADEAALRVWDELEASSLRSSSTTIDEEGAQESQEGEREEGHSDRNSASVTSDDIEERSERSSDENDERQDSTDSGGHRRRRRRSRKLWWAQSRATRQAIAGDDTTSTTARQLRSHRRVAGGETDFFVSASSSSRTHTAPPSLANGEGIASEFRIHNKKRGMCTSACGAASLPHQWRTLSSAADKRSRSGGNSARRTRSNSTVDRYNAGESETAASSTAASVVSEADEELTAGGGSSSRRTLARARRPRLPGTSLRISVAASVSSSSRASIHAKRVIAKALEKRYEGIEEAMRITRSKSVLIHTLERQTHAHLPRLLAAAALRQRRLMMMSTRPAVAAAAAALHADPSLMSPILAPHRGPAEFLGASSVPATRAIILIGSSSSGFNGGGASTALPPAASLTASPAPHFPSSLDIPFAAVTTSTVAVPASPLHQLARATSSTALMNSGSEHSDRVSGAVPCQDGAPSPPPVTSTASLTAYMVGNGSSVTAAAHTLLQSPSEQHRTAAAVGGSRVNRGMPPSTDDGPMQPSNEEVVDENSEEEEEQLAPVSWKFAFFMSRREARRVNITLQDLLEGMWVACFRSSGRTHPIRFFRQHQVFVYPPLPTSEAEEEQRLRQSGLEPSEVSDVTTTASAVSANWAAPPLPFHILQGGAQLVVHQFPPMKVVRRNAAPPVNAAAACGIPAAAAPTPSASPPATDAVTPAMMAERRFSAEPQATLRKLRLSMLSPYAHGAATFKAMTRGSATGGLAAGCCAVDNGHHVDAVRDFGGRHCTCFYSYEAAAVASTAKANDVRRVIAQRLGASAAYMDEVLGQPFARSGAEHASKDGGATARRGCSAAACQGRKQQVFYGPPTQREYEAQQRCEACFEPGGVGDVLNDWGWTISSQNVKIFSLDVTAPLYVERLHRLADVDVIGRGCAGVHDTGIS